MPQAPGEPPRVPWIPGPLEQSTGSAAIPAPAAAAIHASVARLSRRTFGRFELLEEVGRGAMGVVYRARDGRSGGEVALKIIRATGLADARDVSRFGREAKLLARVRHPGIVALIDAGVEANLPFIALDFVRGKPLSRATLEREARIALLAKVARAVGAAHAASIVHRDLKPSNILVEEGTGEPRVVDFGLAFDANLGATRLSQTGELLGTPAYMAPETVRGGARPDDPRIDVYALGVLLHEALAGVHPFYAPGDLVAEVFRKIAAGAPSLVGARGVDPLLAGLAARALAADPDRRPPDGDAFALELEGWLAGARAAAPGRRRAAVLAVLALAAVAGAAALSILARKPPPPPPKVATPLPPPPPPPPRVAPGAEIAELGAALRRLERGEVGDLESFVERTRTLADRFPEDARAVHLAGFGDACRPGLEHVARRELVRAGRLTPALGAEEASRELRLSWMLGFERAAVALAERRFPDAATQPPEIQNLLMHLYLKTGPPVANPERAERLAERLLAAKTPATIDEYPESHLLEMARANARVGLGDAEGAARFYSLAAKTAPGTGPRFFEELAAAARADGVKPLEMGRAFFVFWSTTPFLQEVVEKDQLRDGRDPGRAAKAYLSLAPREESAGQLEHAALAYLRAGRAFALASRLDESRDALRSAERLDLAGAPDTRALVCRALAGAVLEPDPARAEELAREACSPAARGAFDARTPDELADAWALVARARLARGDRNAAREAVRSGRAEKPCDTRELDALDARLERP